MSPSKSKEPYHELQVLVKIKIEQPNFVSVHFRLEIAKNPCRRSNG